MLPSSDIQPNPHLPSPIFHPAWTPGSVSRLFPVSRRRGSDPATLSAGFLVTHLARLNHLSLPASDIADESRSTAQESLGWPRARPGLAQPHSAKDSGIASRFPPSTKWAESSIRLHLPSIHPLPCHPHGPPTPSAPLATWDKLPQPSMVAALGCKGNHEAAMACHLHAVTLVGPQHCRATWKSARPQRRERRLSAHPRP